VTPQQASCRSPTTSEESTRSDYEAGKTGLDPYGEAPNRTAPGRDRDLGVADRSDLIIRLFMHRREPSDRDVRNWREVRDFSHSTEFFAPMAPVDAGTFTDATFSVRQLNRSVAASGQRFHRSSSRDRREIVSLIPNGARLGSPGDRHST
jgi:hypothetical protein